MSFPPLILASASPRRAALLRGAGIDFQVVVSPADEPSRKPVIIPVELWPMCLAYMKAQAVQSKLNVKNAKYKMEEAIILAADTIVVAGSRAGEEERILNKAADRAHARRILSLLNGKTHRVITGCCLLRGPRIRLFSDAAVCKLKLTAQALTAYLASGLWKGKAGAYGIQDRGDPFVELLSGEFATVVGLPIHLVQSELASFAKD